VTLCLVGSGIVHMDKGTRIWIQLTHFAIEPAVHGRWWRRSIHPRLFMPWAARDAEPLIQDWADHQDWADPGFTSTAP
jgi:hypothetical protein